MAIIRRILSKILLSQEIFEFFQKFGVHVMRKHFYSPIPDTKVLSENVDIWEEEKELVGVDLNVKGQMDMLEKVFPVYREEFNFPLDRTSIPWEYYINCGAFGLISAAVLHCMIRYFAPRTIIEVGSGNSTYISARAGLLNQKQGKVTNLISIEPYPNEVIKKGFPGLSRLIPEKVEKIDIGLFSHLEEGDILFIDSSHVVKIGGDVNFLYLDVLPRLKKGVIVHIHDIFFPAQYPKDQIIKNRNFWTEQYLLRAFLIYNSHFEVLWCGSYMYSKYLKKLKSIFPSPGGLGFRGNYFSSSFWMRKT